MLGLFALPVAAAPSVSILVPTEGAAVPFGEEVQLLIEAQDFLFVDYKNNTERFPGNPDAGYALFWLDSEGELELESGNKMLSDRVVNLGKLPIGEHRLVVELIRNDVSRFDPPITAETSFTIGEDGSEILQGGILFALATLFFVGISFLFMRRAYQRFTRHSQ